MKLLSLLIFSISICLNLNNEIETVKYCKALKFVENSKSIKKFFKVKSKDSNFFKVSEQVINNDVYSSFFKEELLSSGIAINDSIHLVGDSAIISRDDILKKLSSNKNSEIIIFFSEIEANYLFLEILKDTDSHSDSYKDLTTFNTSQVILLVFDVDDNIINSFIKEFNYN